MLTAGTSVIHANQAIIGKKVLKMNKVTVFSVKRRSQDAIDVTMENSVNNVLKDFILLLTRLNVFHLLNTA